MIAISHNERQPVRNALGSDAMVMNIPFDFLIFTPYHKIAVERKRFPRDFINSVQNGQMVKECAAMRDWADVRYVIVEGRGRYDEFGSLILNSQTSRFTEASIRGLIRNIREVELCEVEYTKSILGTIHRLHELQKYYSKKEHISMRNRPSMKNEWNSHTYEDELQYWVQGIPCIRATRARNITKQYRIPLELFNAEIEDLAKIKGIGKGTATKIYNFLRGIQ